MTKGERRFKCIIVHFEENSSYIGIPLSCYYLVNLIQEQTKLADDFGIHITYPSKIFF